MNKSRRTRVDMTQITKGLESLREVKEPVARAMALAMGVDVRDEAKIRAPILQAGNKGTDNQQPGVLRDAIYVAYDNRRQVLNQNAFRYTVSWNSTKAPHGHLIEFGHFLTYEYGKTKEGLFYTPLPGVPNKDGFFVQAYPFLGPAFDAKLPRLASVAYSAGEIKFREIMK